MKILFTKNIDTALISNMIGDNIDFECKEFITAEKQEQNPFEIQDKILIFTSMNGVRFCLENGFKIDKNQIFVVGSKTEKSLLELGYKVEKSFSYASELAHFVENNNIKGDIIHFCGNLALDIFSKDTHYHKVMVYQTNLLYPKIEQKYDIVVFFSPSGVRSFAKFNSFQNLKTFAIGTTTEKELKQYTDCIKTSSKATLDDILIEIKKEL